MRERETVCVCVCGRETESEREPTPSGVESLYTGLDVKFKDASDLLAGKTEEKLSLDPVD